MVRSESRRRRQQWLAAAAGKVRHALAASVAPVSHVSLSHLSQSLCVRSAKCVFGFILMFAHEALKAAPGLISADEAEADGVDSTTLLGH